ncbi:altronate dehydratase [Propioniciclava coleopterorum]|uniref:Altronate dehydratase n=1 Tax=Propioniciclava coleopterorum TaxID=2714937 RepID=A0A6G7Y905_9ACTN|nr:altronate dehydratase family protein [Propioniciclava coleopterorum]QIK73097.1 altronate dehydratase [Propioniciclava coleopterorum]
MNVTASDDVEVVTSEGGAVPAGHKVAVRPVRAGSPVRKFGHVIGYATADIAVGEHVHSHNLAFGDHTGEPAAADAAPAWTDGLPTGVPTTFRGIRRPDGRVATRNVIAVASTVNCSATVCQRIASTIERAGLLDAWDGVDAVVPITHTTGCGLAVEGPDMDQLRRTLAGYAGHVNVAGLVVVALGCEMNQISAFLDAADLPAHLPVERLAIQEVGGTRATVEAGVAAVERLAAAIGPVEREDIGVDELVLGLNCGGSDGWSSLTANPALGVASDLLVAHGGTSVLAETPEIYGAEDLLLGRAEPATADRLRAIIARWEREIAAAGETLDNNPSPGNKAGGITTILEKSLGAVSKAGHAPLAAVYEYAQRIDTPGLGFMDTPGYDPVSVTGLIAGGANVVVFTTGRGSALGSQLVPVIKVATNTPLFERMRDDMDLNAGDVVDAGVPLADKGRELYELIVATASGRRTASEELGYGSQEFIPWMKGPTY